jgi:predicted Rossmann fold nucleotide-binding protein DprA/Smf involved in DNA uptake
MSLSKSFNKNHDDAVVSAESTRQSVVNVAGASQATVRTADINFYKSCITSGLAQGVDVGAYIHAVRNLGGTV